MPTVKTIDLTCPNCDYRFVSSTMDAGELAGRRRTDFQVETFGPAALPFGVHLCERCGFAGPADWFGESAVLSYDVRRRVWDELTPRVSSTPISASEKYEFAALVAAWDGAGERDVAELWLRAAWCCVDEGDVEAERYYRRFAVRGFEACLADHEAVAANERAALTYLIGELWRRIGNTGRARHWFNRVPREIVDQKNQAWLVRWALQQQDDPREWFV